MKMRLAGNPNVIKYFKNWIVNLGNAERLCIQMELCSSNLQVFIKCNEIGGPAITQAKGSPRFMVKEGIPTKQGNSIPSGAKTTNTTRELQESK